MFPRMVGFLGLKLKHTPATQAEQHVCGRQTSAKRGSGVRVCVRLHEATQQCLESPSPSHDQIHGVERRPKFQSRGESGSESKVNGKVNREIGVNQNRINQVNENVNQNQQRK